ncbi:hypothetical protein BP6252_14053 [Coleophoma cylindrospora]|uniref:Apple domain-containing protein n=1 Tax=Coleophoma cylindrospora TaxID=1849047 RepID=A0A3D8Q4Q0_9HELO|nr:hypothetical protein BP6252_14053 [Coleophoma cylindrospora]
MKSVFVLSTLAVLATANPLLQDRATCNADNCARAVTGSMIKPTLALRLADCTSFLLATVTPAVVTSTTTVTPDPVSVTTTIVVVATATTPIPAITTITFNKRLLNDGAIINSPSAVPTYASACSGTVRYSSACSCASVTKSTKTLVAVTTYTTVTAIASTTTATATSTTTLTPLPTQLTNIQGMGTCRCTYNIQPNQVRDSATVITSATVASTMDCLNLCDNYNACLAADYTHSSQLCRIYYGTPAFTEGLSLDDDTITFAGTCSTVYTLPGCI